MADKPIFAPDQDMSNVSPADVAEAKRRAKETVEFDKADKTPPKPKKMAAGGSASSRADGICQRGKTRGTFIACGGGMMK